MNRRHDIDVLRFAAFTLLIIYHVGMVYVADWGFHFKSARQWEWLHWPMLGMNRWRMPLIFILSGLALGLARPERGPARFALRRTKRLLLPLAFGMLAVVPVQAYVEALSHGAVAPGFAAFMSRYLQLRPWPDGGFTGAEFGVTWNHLWYLPYLWTYTILLMPAVALRPPSGAAPRLSRLHPGRWPAAVLILLPVVYLTSCLAWVAPRFPTTHALFDDWSSHAQYFPVLVFGYLVALSGAFWSRLDRIRWAALALAILGLAGFFGLRVLDRAAAGGLLADGPWRAASLAAQALYGWTMLLTILAFGRRWLNRPFRWLPWANEAVYPWYILHQSLIVPLAFGLAALPLPGGVEAALVVLGTVLGCAILQDAVIRRSAVLRPLFGLKPVLEEARGTRTIETAAV